MSEIHRLKNKLQAAQFLNEKLDRELTALKTSYHAMHQTLGAILVEHLDGQIAMRIETIQIPYNITHEVIQDGELVIYTASAILDEEIRDEYQGGEQL